MKLKNIFNTMSVAAVALLATACNDTDAQYSIPDVAAPQLVDVSTELKPAFFGETTFKVKFNQKVNFATKDAQLVTVNGSPADKALVLGADSALTVTSTLGFCKSVTVRIPAGLITNAQGKAYNEPIEATFNVKPMPSNNATAVTQMLGWGWNLGNHFDTSAEAIKSGWGYWDGVDIIGTAPFQQLASAGAKTVRMPVTWEGHMDDAGVISADFLDELAGAVDKALAAGLNVILNTHHDSFETTLGDAAANPEEAYKDSVLITGIWTQVANRFASYGEKLIFETFNEVHTGDDWSATNTSQAEFNLLNEWNQYAVNAIRQTGGNNATRWIGVAGYAANIDLTLAHFKMPQDPANRLIVAVHCYDPYNFCLAPSTSGVDSWGHNANPSTSVSGANEDYIVNQLYKLREAFIENNIPCYLGEYGCVWMDTENANAFRAYYLEFFCRAANYAGIPMFVWDNNAKGSGDEANGYIDHADGSWLNDSESMVPTMIRACTSTDDSYWFDTIWNKSPVYTGK